MRPVSSVNGGENRRLKGKKNISLSQTYPDIRNDEKKETDCNVIEEKRPKTAFTAYTGRPFFVNFTPKSIGKEGPKISIGTKLPSLTNPQQTPGPGSYNPPTSPADCRIRHIFPKSQSNSTPVSPTQNIGYFVEHQFPEIRPVTIGTSTKKTFFNLNDSPAPTYLPETRISQNAHRIAERIDFRYSDETIPGPGAYSPNFRVMDHVPSFPVSGPKTRDSWLKNGESTPGPGSYTPTIKGVNAKDLLWSMNEKQKKKMKKHGVIGIENFVIHIGNVMTVDEAMRYIERHPELRDLIKELMEFILMEKPSDPVGYIHQYFESIKKEKEEKEPKNSNDDEPIQFYF